MCWYSGFFAVFAAQFEIAGEYVFLILVIEGKIMLALVLSQFALWF